MSGVLEDEDLDPQSSPQTISPSLLLLILDIQPLSWSILAQPPSTSSESTTPLSSTLSKAPVQSLRFEEFLTILMVFLNAHLASRWGNEVVVYAATAGRSQQLYPPPPGVAGPSRPRPNVYQPFNLLDSSFESSLKAMVAEEDQRLRETDGKGLNEPPAIVSALTKALCFINRVSPQETSAMTEQDSTSSNAPGRLQPRIMVINATPLPTSPATVNGDGVTKAKSGGESRGGYVGMMNCVFATQKAKVAIDVLTLPPPSNGSAPPIFLQQAAYLTDGIFWRWNGRGGLLQYLHALYLSPPAMRGKPFAVPPQDAVDFRAVCFCHHDVVDVGFVCSVCLSIYCKPLPVCQMCKTKFPFKAIGVLKALAENMQTIPIPDTLPPPESKCPPPAASRTNHNVPLDHGKDRSIGSKRSHREANGAG